jgi:hypothetical protein
LLAKQSLFKDFMIHVRALPNAARYGLSYSYASKAFMLRAAGFIVANLDWVEYPLAACALVTLTLNFRAALQTGSSCCSSSASLLAHLPRDGIACGISGLGSEASRARSFPGSGKDAPGKERQ